MDVDDENELQDTGSFFNWFTEEGDEFGVSKYHLRLEGLCHDR